MKIRILDIKNNKIKPKVKKAVVANKVTTAFFSFFKNYNSVFLRIFYYIET